MAAGERSSLIKGQTSNEDQFKYLMNNAIASKDALNLSVGVSLTSEQVAALTHDIVWLEEHEVNGEKVLVPVLYLAQADNRLAPNGALIAGKDVTLIAGQNLDNVGTLKATNNLSATAGNDLVNSGLVSAGNRLDLLAGNDITNKAGGIIAGRDVTVTAIGGDVTNERTITSLDSDTRGQLHKDYADNAARIEAANDLSVSAGRDINNIGSALQSGRDLTLNAGRDVNIASTQVINSLVLDSKHTSSDITQIGSTVSAGRDLSVQAGRDITAIASQIDAKRDIALAATENVTISSAADEDHFLSKSKKLTVQEDHVSQVATDIKSGGSVAVSAGQNLAVISSRITAGDEAYLVAGDKLDILAAQDSDYSLYDKKKKGSFGSKKTKRDEVTQVTNVGSEITSGGNMMLVSGGDQHYQAAKLDSGKDLTLNSGGGILFEGVKDLHQESHEKSKSNLAWNSMSGKGNTDETLRQSELTAKGNLAIKAVDGLHIDVKQVNQQTVSEAIDAMVKADPDLAWLKDAEKRGDVDWQLIKETHDSYKYSHSGLGQGAMLAIIIVVTVLTAGTGTAATIGTAAGSAASTAATTAGLGAYAATISSAASAAAVASFSAAVSQAAVSAVNNQGNLGAVLKDVTSADSMKGYLISGLAAGFAAGVLDKAYGVSPDDAVKATHGFELGTVDGFTQFASYTFAENGFTAVAGTAIQGGSLKDNLAQAAISSAADALSAGLYNRLGTQLEFSGLPAKLGAHALVGGLIAELAGGDFKSGALAAGANEAFVASIGDYIFTNGLHDQLLGMTSQLIGLTVAAAAWGSDKAQAIAGWVATQATKFNSLDHPTAEKLLNELQGCKTSGGCSEAKIREIVAKYEGISANRSKNINNCPTRQCVEEIRKATISMDDPVAQELLAQFRHSISYDMYGLISGDPSQIAAPSQGAEPWGATFVTDKQIATAKYIQEGWLTPEEQAALEAWDTETAWMDRAAGEKLTVKQKASTLLEITSVAAMMIIGGRGTTIKQAAADLGYGQRIPPQKAPFDSHGQSVFYNGKQYITRDVDAHNVSNGWKVFDKKRKSFRNI